MWIKTDIKNFDKFIGNFSGYIKINFAEPRYLKEKM